MTWTRARRRRRQAENVLEPGLAIRRVVDPGVSNMADAAVIERTRVTRPDLNQLIGLPGYNEAAIREVLEMVRPVWLCRGQRLDHRTRRAR